jgi:hypothetical protein
MKGIALRITLALAALAFSGVAYADTKGKVTHVMADPYRVYFAIDSCAPKSHGPYYYIDGSEYSADFLNRVHGLLMAAYLSGKTVRVGVEGSQCPSAEPRKDLAALWVNLTEQ